MGNECVMYSCVFLSCLELVVFGVLFVLNGNLLLTKKDPSKVNISGCTCVVAKNKIALNYFSIDGGQKREVVIH